MKCPFCKEENDKVIDSRAAEGGYVIRRRRECIECKRRYTTYERIEEIPLRVIKKDGRRVPFERRKILGGLIKACEKLPVSLETLEKITAKIEAHINDGFVKEIPSKEIGELVMKELKALDKVAYVRFASVYREFKDVNEFVTEVKPMLKKGGK